MTPARTEILARVRAAVARGERTSLTAPMARDALSALEDIAEQFAERARDYGASVTTSNASEVAETLGRICRRRGVACVVTSMFPSDWLPPGVAVLDADEIDARALDAVGVALTTCSLGVSETGTLVLTGAPGEGKRALSLLPDYHLCVLNERDLVRTVDDAFARLADICRPITLISGPSATSDIEFERVEGVHGPRTVDIVLVR